MNRRLLVLNLLLVAGLIYAGTQFHARRMAERAREAATLNGNVPPLPPPALSPQPAPAAVTAASFETVAQRDLFDASRNPNVPIELPPPPPPPKNPPPMPYFHGMMNIGDGPIAIMSQTAGGRQEEVKAGGMIGEFKLVAFNLKDITLEWDGRTFHKRADDHGTAGDNAGPETNTPMNIPGRPVMPGVESPPPPPPVLRDLGPGADNGTAYRPCQQGDGSPNGAVVDGYVKVLRPGLFGQDCHWQPVGKQ